MIDLGRFNTAASSCGFRGYVSEIKDGYAMRLESDEVTYLQLAKFADIIGTRHVRVLTVHAGAHLRLEATWPERLPVRF